MMNGKLAGVAVVVAGAAVGGVVAWMLSTGTDRSPAAAVPPPAASTSSPAASTGNALCDPKEGAADLTLTMPSLDGRTVALSAYKGKVLLLDFWATWCPPCKVEIPWFIEFYDKYRTQGLEVVGAVVLDDFKLAPPFAREWKMNYPILDANDRADIEKAYGPFVALPTSLLIGRDGRICQRHIGLTGRDEFEKAIKALL